MFTLHIYRELKPREMIVTNISQLAQDDEGFEIASVRDSLDMDDDDEPGPPRPPPYDRAPSHPSASDNKNQGVDRSVSPLPAPTPQRPGLKPAESLDGETVFAVGGEEEDGGGFSDSDEEEDRRLKPRDH